jgi:hypothetical protein
MLRSLRQRLRKIQFQFAHSSATVIYDSTAAYLAAVALKLRSGSKLLTKVNIRTLTGVRTMKDSQESSSTSTSTAEFDRAQLPKPYIREAPLGNNELPIATANGGFNVIIPGLTSASFNRVIIFPLDGTNEPYPVPIRDAFLQVGVDAVLTYSAESINNAFRIGNQVKISSDFWLVEADMWTRGTESVLYTIVP